MTDFDPNTEPETQEQADAYVNWAAENFMRLFESGKRDNRTAVRCAHWLLVVSVAQLHLAEGTADYDALLEQLAMYQGLARRLERQREGVTVERLLVLRSSLDCWEALGGWAGNLLAASKCAVAALILISMHQLVDLWDLEFPDVWAQLEAGKDYLANINESSVELEFDDFAVQRDDAVAAKFTWQRVNNISRRVGMPPLSPN